MRRQSTQARPVNPGRPDPKPPASPVAGLRHPVPALPVLEVVADWGDPRHPLERTPQRVPLRLPKADKAFFDLVTAQNVAAEGGQDVAQRTVFVVRGLLPEGELRRVAMMAAHLDDTEANTLLDTLGFVLACVERQYRVHHGLDQDGFALRAVPGLEEALLALAARTGRPPCGDAKSTWGAEQLFSFTGTDGERRFGESVRAAEVMLGGAADRLNAVRTGQTAFVDAADDLLAAAAAVADYTQVQAAMVKDPFPEDFKAFRNYLVEVNVGGEQHQGPNATYMPAWNRLDLAVGVYDDRYLKVLPVRVAHMWPADSAQVDAERRTPSIAYLVSVVLGLRPAELAMMDPADLARRMEAAPQSSHAALAAAATLARNTAKLSGVHYGVIMANLVKPAQAEGVTATATHSASTGVSGTPLSHTEGLMQMRLTHALARVKFGR